MQDSPSNEAYGQDLVIAVSDYGKALQVDLNSDPEVYVERFSHDRHQEVRRILMAERRHYPDLARELDELALIMKSPDLGIDERWIAFFRKLRGYTDESESNEK